LAKPALSIEPQLGIVWSPRPMNSRPAWMAMATEAIDATWMIRGARTTRSTCRKMIRRSDRPDTRAASTYSSPRTACTVPRTSRNTEADSSTPKIVIAHQAEGPTTARAASSTTMPGRAIRIDAAQDASPSNHLPK
jgi:hypothetical protein